MISVLYEDIVNIDLDEGSGYVARSGLPARGSTSDRSKQLDDDALDDAWGILSGEDLFNQDFADTAMVRDSGCRHAADHRKQVPRPRRSGSTQNDDDFMDAYKKRQRDLSDRSAAMSDTARRAKLKRDPRYCGSRFRRQ